MPVGAGALPLGTLGQGDQGQPADCPGAAWAERPLQGAQLMPWPSLVLGGAWHLLLAVETRVLTDFPSQGLLGAWCGLCS